MFYNFYILPFKQAVHLPILISPNSRIKISRGGVQMNGKICPAMIQIGYNNVGTIDSKRDKTIIEIAKGGKLICNNRIKIGSGCKLSIGKSGCIDCKGILNVTARSTFISHKRITFGDNVLISWDCLFMDTDFHKIFDNGNEINSPSEIIIGNNVWIGCRATILKGSEISDGCVIGAGSLINKVLETGNSIYAGTPSKLLKKDILWEV